MEPFQRILIPTDGSENAKAAAAKGLQLAKVMGAEVTALSVADYSAVAISTLGYGIEDVLTAIRDGAKAAVARVRQEGEAMGLAVKTMVSEGFPADEIIKASKDYDLIVMGTLGRTGLSHLLLGSVAEKVVRFATCPVLVVRTPEAKKGE
jgi:nucleotide-binding universal stress UspA family protein